MDHGRRAHFTRGLLRSSFNFSGERARRRPHTMIRFENHAFVRINKTSMRVLGAHIIHETRRFATKTVITRNPGSRPRVREAM